MKLIVVLILLNTYVTYSLTLTVQSSPQRIEIHLNFIGEFELPNAEREATPEELAEQERIEKVREYDRQRYQKRKAAGYYDKQKTEPKKTERATATLPMAANQ
jgi:hypothetical protein